MSFRRRAAIVGLIAAVAAGVYIPARLHAYSLVIYVVEQSLIQKAPPGTDPAVIHERLGALLAAIPGRDAKLARVLAISQFVEKVQSLTPQDLEQLLTLTNAGSARWALRNMFAGTFCHSLMSM